MIPHPSPAARRARSLDEELLDSLRAAPAGLDDKTYGRIFGVLQSGLRGSIHDVYDQHFAGAC